MLQSGILYLTYNNAEAMISGELNKWVDNMAGLTQPERLFWCKGTVAELKELIQTADQSKTDLLKGFFVNPEDTSKLLVNKPEEWLPIIEKNSIKSNYPVIQMLREDQVGLQRSIHHLLENSMTGRTMYVVPFSMSPKGAPVEYVAVELTDSPLAVVLRYQNSLVGYRPLSNYINDEFVHCLHTRGKMYKASELSKPGYPCNLQKSFIISCPERRNIWSYGPYYGCIRPGQTTRYAWWV